jgi:hypothetical protein
MGISTHACVETCKNLIDATTFVQKGSVACGWFEIIKILYCPPTEIKNPSDACPYSPTEGNDDVQPFDHLGDSLTCASLFDDSGFIQNIEEDSDYCAVLGTFCCPLVPSTITNPSTAAPIAVTYYPTDPPTELR